MVKHTCAALLLGSLLVAPAAFAKPSSLAIASVVVVKAGIYHGPSEIDTQPPGPVQA